VSKAFIQLAGVRARSTVELLEGRDLRRRILESYSRDPRGWSFEISPSPGTGFFDATVSGPEGVWLLKIDSLFKPSPLVVGSPAEAITRKPGGPFPYGYRPMPPDLALQIMGSGSPGSTLASRRRLLSVLSTEPVVPEEGRSYAQGPLLLTGPRTVSLSESQEKIDLKLATEMRRLLRLRYPAYG
jgi:hypothetical protein